MKQSLGKKVRSGPPETEKMDMQRDMIFQNRFLMHLLGWPVAAARSTLCRARVHKERMENIKQPFIIVANHNAFYDFYVFVHALKPFTGIYPAAIDDFIGRETFLRMGGCVPKRKYTSDLNTVLQCKKALENGENFGIFAEARYSLCGTTEMDALTDSLGQLVKLMGVPCVTFKSCGHHLTDPFWGNHVIRFLPHTDAYVTQILTAEEVKASTAEEINRKIREYIDNDDWRWQYENHVAIRYKKRAEGLHKPLYMCPHCRTEYRMKSKDDYIWCDHCRKRWYLSEYGELKSPDGVTEFKFPSDWYSWERECVQEEVLSGKYHFECDCHVNELPNSKGFVRLGKGHLIHNMETGFLLEGIRDYDGKPFKMHIDPAAQNSVHVEYNYRYGNHKDCIDLNTLKDTYYAFPENCNFSVTKVTLAAEAIYKEVWRKKAIKKL